MTDYQELKRLAEAAKACAHLSYYTSHEGDFQVAASPDVVLGLLADVDELKQIIEQRNAMLSRGNADFMQAITDPENQPSQFGTVTLAMYEALEAKNQALREALKDATDEIESWGAYASEYFQAKHDLAGNVAKFRAIIQAEGGV